MAQPNTGGGGRGDRHTADWDDAALYPMYTPTMPESDLHCWSLDVLKMGLREHLARTGVENYRLFEQRQSLLPGGPTAGVSGSGRHALAGPALHVPGQPYRTWMDGIPELVVEVLFPDNWANDVGFKKDEYADMGVQEYWLFDPHTLCLDIPRHLQGHRLQHGAYMRIVPVAAHVEDFPTQLHFSNMLAAAWGLDNQQRLRIHNAEEGFWYPLEGVEATRRKRRRERKTPKPRLHASKDYCRNAPGPLENHADRIPLPSM